MSVKLTIPQLGLPTSQAKLVEWKVGNGAAVVGGEVICILESAETTRDFEAPASGTLVQKVAAGQAYPFGAEIGEIIDEEFGVSTVDM